MRRFDGLSGIPGSGIRDHGKLFSGRGVTHRKGTSGCGFNPLPADVVLIPPLDCYGRHAASLS